MRIIIEEHQYPASVVEDVLDGITNLRDVEGKVSVNYVGYYYNPKLNDCVFILPKVLMEDKNGEEQVFWILRVFHVHYHATMDEDRMRKAWYPEPQGKYFCYVFDEEVTLGTIDTASLIKEWSDAHPDEKAGTPIFVKGEDLLKYRKPA